MECTFYKLQFTKRAQKDIKSLSPKLQEKLKDILRRNIAIHPEAGKSLFGSLQGYYSVRLSYQDRIVYRIEKDVCTVIIVRARIHYGE